MIDYMPNSPSSSLLSVFLTEGVAENEFAVDKSYESKLFLMFAKLIFHCKIDTK